MTTAEFGAFTDERPWRDMLPPAVFAGLSEWVQGQGFNLMHRRWLTDGHSGSYVALVLVHPARGSVTGAVLKLLPPSLASREARACNLAWQLSPKPFAAAHLVRSWYTGPLAGTERWWVQLQEMGQAELADVRPLDRLSGDASFGNYCATVIEGIVNGWNPGTDDSAPVLVNAGQFVRDDLGNRAREVQAFVAAAGMGVEPAEGIRFAHRQDTLPDPLALFDAEASQPEVVVFRGNGHGDLHPGNVLVPVDDCVRADRFRLIDYGRFSSSMPVSRDPVKLALSAVAASVDFAADPGANSPAAEAVAAPAATSDRRYACATYIYTAAQAWARRRQVVAEFARQHRLVLVASALRTVGRPELRHAERLWHLEVAALALRELLTDHPIALGGGLGAAASDEPAASGSPAEYSPAVKREFCRRLADDWRDLADELNIPAYQRTRFRRGDEVRAVWEWAEVRGLLSRLPALLRTIGREDLALLFEPPSWP
ncbi:hypothetical protein AB0M46_35410 [Dactylosporangium sp. NPDC051485]|uniref:hypothetical protein n=1 Tax=Dactylosporangium sp. NPDC051485 TaxID=3154846 RepID=UPI0034465265